MVCRPVPPNHAIFPFRKCCVFPAAALHLNTRRHHHVWSFDTDSVQSDFLLLFFTYRCPIYQTSVDTVCEEMLAPRFSSSSSYSMLSFSTSAVGYTDQQTSRLYRPVSVVSHLCSNSSCPCVSNLSNLFMCVQCAWVLPIWKFLTMFQYASILVSQCLHFNVFLPTSSRVFKVSIFQLRHSPFFTWFVLRFTSFS